MNNDELKYQISKKKQKCDLCSHSINVGEKHKSWWNKPTDIEWEGEFQNTRMHKNCWGFEEYILKWNDFEGWGFDDISDNIYQIEKLFPNEKWKGEIFREHRQWCIEDEKLANKLVRETDWIRIGV